MMHSYGLPWEILVSVFELGSKMLFELLGRGPIELIWQVPGMLLMQLVTPCRRL